MLTTMTTKILVMMTLVGVMTSRMTTAMVVRTNMFTDTDRFLTVGVTKMTALRYNDSFCY